jgi:hypothetical protein
VPAGYESTKQMIPYFDNEPQDLPMTTVSTAIRPNKEGLTVSDEASTIAERVLTR